MSQRLTILDYFLVIFLHDLIILYLSPENLIQLVRIISTQTPTLKQAN